MRVSARGGGVGQAETDRGHSTCLCQLLNNRNNLRPFWIPMYPLNKLLPVIVTYGDSTDFVLMLHLKVILAPHFFYVSNHKKKSTNHVHTQKRSNNEKDSIVEYGFSDYTTSVFVFVVFCCCCFFGWFCF